MRRRFLAAVLSLPLLPGCGGDWAFKSDHSRDGDSKPSGGATIGYQRLALEPSPGGRLPATRPGSEVILRFTGALDPASARGAVRVEDGTRGPVAAEVAVRGRELVLRPRSGTSWRPGGKLLVRVSGLPSLRALRSASGDPLDRDVEVIVTVRSPRRTDRTAPVLLSSEPARGALGVDPAAPLHLRFSEAMDVRALSIDSRGSPWDPVRVEAGGEALPYRAFLDRSRTGLTLLPLGGLPPETEVTVELGDRVRDASGNRLDRDSVRTVRFATGPAGPGGLLVEAFEDGRRLDPLGTTVRWNHHSEPGVLSGVLESLVLETGAGGEERALLLDQTGGTLRVFVPASELGDEPRVLKALHLVAAPGSAGGEILAPRLRVAPVEGPAVGALGDVDPLDAVDPEAWQEMAGETVRCNVRGGVYAIVFRHPLIHDGVSGLAVEFSWSGTRGSVILRATRDESPTVSISGPGPVRPGYRLAPVLRVGCVGARAVARSRWMDAGTASPSWLTPVPSPAPAGASVRLQGAPAGPDGGPDLLRASDWTDDPAALEGMRWIRFRVVFGSPAALDRLDLPFVAR
jgi:hypothetical protein